MHDRFSKTGVFVDSPSVVCPFGTLKVETTEVTPAYHFKEREDGFSTFKIPDGNGGWMKSSPLAHNNYVSEIDASLSYKVKPLIRFLKALKYYRSIPISSFYLEIRVAKYAAKESSILYSTDIKNILKHIVDNDLPAVIDPTGSGYINPCKTEALKKDALSKLKTALTRATNAQKEESNGNCQKAFEWWDKFFYYEFPSYTGK